MLKIIYIKQTILLCLAIFVLGCSKDSEPEHIHEEEVITRVTLSVKKEGSSTPVLYTWNDDHDEEDHSGEEDHDEEESQLKLDSNSTYEVEVSFYNASNPSNIEDITEEVQEEADEHQVFYEIIGMSGMSIMAASGDTKDSNGSAVLLKTVWKTTAVTKGEVRVYLIHEPTSKTGSTRTDFGGETDVKVDFHVDVQ
jgi:hypothetical protein